MVVFKYTGYIHDPITSKQRRNCFPLIFYVVWEKKTSKQVTVSRLNYMRSFVTFVFTHCVSFSFFTLPLRCVFVSILLDTFLYFVDYFGIVFVSGFMDCLYDSYVKKKKKPKSMSVSPTVAHKCSIWKEVERREWKKNGL